MSQSNDKSILATNESKRLKIMQATGTASAINKLDSVEQVTATQSAQTGSAVKHIQEVQVIRSSSSIDHIEESHSLYSQFESLVLGQAQALEDIKKQVQSGLLSEEQAEEELLLLMLSQSMNIPKVIAHQMLPSFKQSISEQEELRQGLRTLWQK